MTGGTGTKAEASRPRLSRRLAGDASRLLDVATGTAGNLWRLGKILYIRPINDVCLLIYSLVNVAQADLRPESESALIRNQLTVGCCYWICTL